MLYLFYLRRNENGHRFHGEPREHREKNTKEPGNDTD